MEIIFAGKGSDHPTGNVTNATKKAHATIKNLIPQIEKCYTDAFRGIRVIPEQDSPPFSGAPKLTIYRTREPSLCLCIGADREGLQDDPKITGAFESMWKGLDALLQSCDPHEAIDFSFGGGIDGNYKSICVNIRPEQVAPGYFVCPKCDARVEDSSENYSMGLEWKIAVCPEQGVGHGLVLFSESQLLQPINNLSCEKYSIDKNLRICRMNKRSARQRRIVWELNLLAKHEELEGRYFSFKSISERNADESEVYVLAHKRLPVGYAYWNKFAGQHPKRALRQLYILPEYRRKGFGTALVRKTANIESPDRKFIIETPIAPQAEGALVNAGLVRRMPTSLECVKCHFVQGGF